MPKCLQIMCAKYYDIDIRYTPLSQNSGYATVCRYELYLGYSALETFSKP